jgi:hypothetical protein
MGSFIGNVHVRSQDRQAAESALATLRSTGAWITSPKNGWISIFEERASTQDGDWIRSMAESLSNALRAPAIGFLVHDSDILCYWLCDKGKLIDEYNSCPDYFGDGDEPAGPSGGDPRLLLPYCIADAQLANLRRILAEQEYVFADERLTDLAKLLGIEAERALGDFGQTGREIHESENDAVYVGTNARAAVAGDEDDDERADDKPISGAVAETVREMQKMLQSGAKPGSFDANVEKLVHAAATGDLATIERLVAEGAKINELAPLSLATRPGSSPAQTLLGGSLVFPVSPLMGAVAHKQIAAVRRLIELGADVNGRHPIVGTALHAAAIGSDPALIKLICEAGGDVNALNLQRQTPLQTLQYFRQMTSRLNQLGALNPAMVGALKSQWEKLMPAAEVLDECERILRHHASKE